MVEYVKPTEGFLRAGEGLRLFWRGWEAQNPRAVGLLAHGLGEHSGRYEALAQWSSRNAVSLFAIDHRGHGRSGGQRGDLRSLAEVVEDLHRLVEEAKRQNPKLPRVLIGHSLGGLIALNYAARHPEGINGVAVSSPALRLARPAPSLKVAMAHALARLLPRTPIPNGVNPADLSRDPQVAQRYEADPLVHRVITARTAITLKKAMEESIALAPKLKIPCLILVGGADKVCDPQAAYEFSQHVDSTLVRFRRYEGLYHELFNEPEREEVLADLLGWMKEVVG